MPFQNSFQLIFQNKFPFVVSLKMEKNIGSNNEMPSLQKCTFKKVGLFHHLHDWTVHFHFKTSEFVIAFI